MVELVVCLRRKKGMSKEDFHRYWREVHGPLVKGVADFVRHVRKYVQHHTVAGGIPGFPASAEEPFDGIAELWFDDADAAGRAFSEPRYLEIIRPDEQKFLDLSECRIFLAEEVHMHGS